MFRDRVADDLPAVVTASGTLSAAELARLATEAIAWLDRSGAPRDRPVPALLTTTLDSMALAVAGATSDRPLAPLNPRLTVRELVACIGPIDAPVIVAEPSSHDAARAAARELGRAVAVVDELMPATTVGLDFARPEGATAVILHTSGTTGIPKPVPIDQRKLALRVQVQGPVMGLGPGTSFASASPFQHIAGLGTLFIALGLGAAAIPSPPFTPEIWQGLARFSPSHGLLVPAMIEQLLAAGALALPSLRTLVYGSSSIRPSTARRAMEAMPGVDLFNMYGQTEGSPLTFFSGDDHRRAVAGEPHLLLTVGRAFPGVELRTEVRDAGPGELCARAEHLFKIDSDGWLRTGDLAEIDGEGYVRLVGRTGDMIGRGGENVAPLEVEQVLAEHSGVAEVAVFGIPDDRLGQEVCAAVVPADRASPPDPAELRAFARERLAGYKVPARWVFTDALPRNAVGKVVRRELAKLADIGADE
jgi:acyl-CoA synthetase (AMP-forming)/AMP-acid ligase II